MDTTGTISSLIQVRMITSTELKQDYKPVEESIELTGTIDYLRNVSRQHARNLAKKATKYTKSTRINRRKNIKPTNITVLKDWKKEEEEKSLIQKFLNFLISV